VPARSLDSEPTTSLDNDILSDNDSEAQPDEDINTVFETLICQAEDCTSSKDCSSNSENEGYTGTGYMDHGDNGNPTQGSKAEDDSNDY